MFVYTASTGCVVAKTGKKPPYLSQLCRRFALLIGRALVKELTDAEMKAMAEQVPLLEAMTPGGKPHPIAADIPLGSHPSMYNIDEKYPRPRLSTSGAAPHFAPVPRRPLRATMQSYATGCLPRWRLRWCG